MKIVPVRQRVVDAADVPAVVSYAVQGHRGDVLRANQTAQVVEQCSQIVGAQVLAIEFALFAQLRAILLP